MFCAAAFSRYRLSSYCVPHSSLLVDTDIVLLPDNLMMPRRHVRGCGGGPSTTTSTRPSVSSTHESAPYTLRSGRVTSRSLAASQSSSVTTPSSATTSSSTITHSATTTLAASGLLSAQGKVADLSVEDFLRVIRAVIQEDQTSGSATSSVHSSSHQQSETSVTWSNTSSAAPQPTVQHPPVVVSPRSQPAVQQG